MKQLYSYYVKKYCTYCKQAIINYEFDFDEQTKCYTGMCTAIFSKSVDLHETTLHRHRDPYEVDTCIVTFGKHLQVKMSTGEIA